MSTDNLFLIGYRCTGKSSVGRSLSAKLGREFVDTDSRVVAENGRTIREIVSSQGWEAFRRLEHRVFKQVCAAQRQVVATGGGIILDAANVERMKASGRVIWLKAAPDTIKIRMMQDQASEGLRPALTVKDSVSEIGEILMEREPLYQSAMDFAVNTDDLEVEEICGRIIEKLKGRPGLAGGK